MRRFQADFQLWGTVYVKADTEKQAKAKIEKLVGKYGSVELIGGDQYIFTYSGDHDSFVSPCMTPTGEIGEIEETGPWFGDTDYDEDTLPEPAAGANPSL